MKKTVLWEDFLSLSYDGSVANVEYLLQIGHPKFKKESFSSKELHELVSLSIVNRKMEMTKFWIDCGIDMTSDEISEIFNRTCVDNNYDVQFVQFLLDNGALVNGPVVNGNHVCLPLKGVLQVQQLKKAKLLLERGSLAPNTCLTALACIQQDEDKVEEIGRMMLNRGAQATNRIALCNAIHYGNFKLAILLWENGASVCVLFFLYFFLFCLYILIEITGAHEHSRIHGGTTNLS